MFAEVLVGFRLARRARYFEMVMGLVLVVLMASFLAAGFSGRQPSVVALDVGISALRLGLPFLLVALVQDLISKEFERRYYLSSLSYPRSRGRMLLGRMGSVLFLVLFAGGCASIFLGCAVWYISSQYEKVSVVILGYHYLVLNLFYSVEVLLLVGLASYLAVVASTPAFVLVGTLGFMLVGRSLSSVLMLLSNNGGGQVGYEQGLKWLMYLIPDLGALDVRMISLYGSFKFLPGDWWITLLSVFSYSAVFFFLALWAFGRKRLF